MLRIAQNSPRLLHASVAVSRNPFRSLQRYADPWVLPGTPEHLATTQTPDRDPDLPEVKPIERKDEDVQTLVSRLTYQSRKRGTLETDLLLSTFARDQLPVMKVEEMLEYDRLLNEPDWDIYYWSTGKRQPPERWANSAMLEKLRVHASNQGKVIRKMPPLEKITRIGRL